MESADASAWDDLVRLHPDASAFHLAAWGRAIHDTYGHKPLYLHFTHAQESAALVPLIEIASPITGRRAVCLPFSDICGPLVFRPDSLGAVKQELAELAAQRRWKYCELRDGDWADSGVEPAVTFYGHTLDLLRDPGAMFARFGNGTRGAIKQAIKNGVVAEISSDREAVRDFYALQVQTRQKHGVPPQPFSFFENVYQRMIHLGLGFIALARFEGRTVAGAVFLAMPQRAIYKFAASDSDCIQTRGNNLVLWEAIRHLSVIGCEQLHFGRTSLENDGLRRFKLSWGAEEQMIQYTRFETKQRSWVPSIRQDGEAISNQISRALPSAVNRFAGEVLYPHLD